MHIRNTEEMYNKKQIKPKNLKINQILKIIK